MTAAEAIDWLANLPKGVSFRYLGPNPMDGGYSCILWVGSKSWWKGGGPKHRVEGQSSFDWDEDEPSALEAINSARWDLERQYWRTHE